MGLQDVGIRTPSGRELLIAALVVYAVVLMAVLIACLRSA